ncbi:hypothetical protein CALVIDRAFT_559522 [Calocera viscosa TUFC12733]|uniref:Nuclear pore complex protein Nup153 n=1 Tax=Calocera viscosa (strain TUFC12733) TaxID=1330018 RepID=A0A167SA69_CALVF|nr:hypothetical protein CALVIDRAFT_559522 [Calocera viscosa TUFC12733]
MDSPHRQARTVARTSARQERSSPYARPRSQSQVLQPALPRTPSSSFLGLLGRAVSWWVGTGPTTETTVDEEGRRSDEEMPEHMEDGVLDGAPTPLGPPGGFGRPQAQNAAETDDDEVQIISPPPPPSGPSRPVVNSQPALPIPRASSFNILPRTDQPMTPKNSLSLSRGPQQPEDTSPERINAAISEFFASKGGEPLTIVEWNGVQKMLEDLRGSAKDGSGEPFELGSPAYSPLAFHPGTPERSSQLRSPRSISAVPRRSTPGRPRTAPIYIGPGFGNSRMRSSAKPEPREPTLRLESSSAEKSSNLSRSTLSASMLVGPSNTPATPAKAAEPMNPSISRLTSKPTVPSPLRNTIPQDSRSPSSDRVSPPKKGPTIAASILKDLMDSDKKESPLQNPYQNRPGAIKGKVKPKIKPLAEKPVTPFRGTPETAKPPVNGTKPAEALTGDKRDAQTAALDEISPPKPAKPASFVHFKSKEPSFAPSPSAAKKPRASFADAQEVDELLEDDGEGATKPSTVFETPAASQGVAKPATSTPAVSSVGTNGGFSFPKPATGVPSFGITQPSTTKSAPSSAAFRSFGASLSAPSDSAAQKPSETVKPPSSGRSGLFSNGAKPSPFTSTTSAFAAFEKHGELSTTPTKSPPTKSLTLSSEAPSLGGIGIGSGAAKPPSTSTFGASNVFGMGGSSIKPASEPTKEATQTPKTSLFGFGATSNAFGAATSSARAPSLGSFGLSNVASGPSKTSSSTLTFPSSFGAPSPSPSTAAPSTSPFGKPSTASSVPATSSFGKSTPIISGSADKPLTFAVPSGFKSPFADASKAATNAFGGAASPLAGSAAASSGISLSRTSAEKASAVTDTAASKDVSMDAPPAVATSSWEKIMSQSTFHKGAKPEPSASIIPRDDVVKDKLPVFAFHLQTPTVARTSTTLSISEDKLPSFSFNTKLISASKSSPAVASVTAVSPIPTPSKSTPPIIAFDFAAAGLAKPTTSTDTWTCSVCMVSNKADAVKCIACETDRPGGAPASLAKVAPEPVKATPPAVVNNWAGVWAPPAAPAGKVTCKHCGLMTDKGLEECQVCQMKDYE